MERSKFQMKWSQWKEKWCRLSVCNNWIWITFVLLESFFSWIKYGTYHKAMADKSDNDCQEYVFNMHRDNCKLYRLYIAQSVCFVLLFVFHLFVKWKQKTVGGDTCSDIALFCGLEINWPTYIQQFLFPHLLILANFTTELIIVQENHAYCVQIITDFFGYLIFFSFMDHGGHLVKEIMSLQKENNANNKNKHKNNRVPKRQCNPFLALNVLICVWAHFEIIWYMFSKLDEDYNWTKITDKNKNGNFKWSKGEENAIFWQIQLELLILIQWVKGSIENILHAVSSKGGHSRDHTPNLNYYSVSINTSNSHTTQPIDMDHDHDSGDDDAYRTVTARNVFTDDNLLKDEVCC